MVDVYVTPNEDTLVVVQGTAQAERFVFRPGPYGDVRIIARGGDDSVADTYQDHLILDMGDGNDSVARVSGDYVDVNLGKGDDVLADAWAEGGAVILGGAGKDRIKIGGLNMRVDGGTGDDVLEVFATDDGASVIGGEGDDTLRVTGEAPGGIDLYGGPGADKLYADATALHLHFVPTGSPRGSGRDRVFGFADGADKLLIDGDADKLRAGIQTYLFVGPGTRPGAGQIMWYPASGGPVVVGSDGRTVFEVKLEGFRGTLDASDFRPR